MAAHDDPVAIVGLSVDFPGSASSTERFWRMLCERRSGREAVPPSRYNVDGFYHRDGSRLDSLNTRFGYFVERDLAAFDAAFFTVSPSEAACMDPQQRILLETTYKALENAGMSLENIAGSRTSVYVASYARDYEAILTRDPAIQSKYQATGTGAALMPGRISYFYDLRGPSLLLDTACSSSCHAIHLACQSIKSGESEMSIIAGSNILLSPEAIGLQISNAGFLSPDGICYAFDSRASGYARGEGFAALILKPLSKAIRDGDNIRSIIRATGINQDGRTPSITQPSVQAQQTLIRETYDSAGLDMSLTGFFEAHGTGTQVGDRIETEVIGSLFREHSSLRPLLIGSVKSNIGHLEGASGLAAVIKATLALETGWIPPNMWLDKVNPAIEADRNRVVVS